MANCKWCGQPLKPGARFCENCGSKVETIAEQLATEKAEAANNVVNEAPAYNSYNTADTNTGSTQQAPYTAPVYTAPVVPAPVKKTDGFGIAALCCGIASILMVCCCFTTVIGLLLPLLLGVAAIILAVVSKKKDVNGLGKMSGLAIGGLICGIAGAALSVIVIIVLIAGLSGSMGDLNNFNWEDYLNELEGL